MEAVDMSTPINHSNFSGLDPNFWIGKKVFLTGHTGFKGGWLSVWLSSMGAKVTGYALRPETDPNFFDVVDVASFLDKSYIDDIRDLNALKLAITHAMPDVLIHMAAQPLVRYSYVNPIETYSTNIMGTVNVLEAARSVDSLKSIVVVTTDKCYQNQEWVWGYRENEPLGGVDPYSSSKACAELVTTAYRHSFFSGNNGSSSAAIASARAGNVIGGGDWSVDRLIPDALAAFSSGSPLVLRNPLATRPWQHVLEPLSGYLILAQALFQYGESFASAWNFGPENEGNKSVQQVIDILNGALGDKLEWKQDSSSQAYEAQLLKLDCSKAHKHLCWTPKWRLGQSIGAIIEWHKAFIARKDMKQITLDQINRYLHEDRS